MSCSARPAYNSRCRNSAVQQPSVQLIVRYHATAMPGFVREYLYAVCLALAAITGIPGILWFRAAMTLDQHLGALVVCVVAAVFLYLGYRLNRGQFGRDFPAREDLPPA